MTRFTQGERYLIELVEGEGDWCDSSSEEEDEIEDSDEIDDSDESDDSDDSDEDYDSDELEENHDSD